MQWSGDALDQGERVLGDYSKQLFDEAGRIAKRARADTVSASYVEAAAVNLSMRAGAPLWVDVVLNFGWALLGAFLGVAVSAQDASLPVWQWIVGGVAVGLVTCGLTAKVFGRV